MMKSPLAVMAAFVVLTGANAAPLSLSPQTMGVIGSVDERFQSYNIEMVEVTGGRFWKPYNSVATDNATLGTPAGMDPNLYEYRTPIDLKNTKLRNLAAALAPAYMRVSGTWANATYFSDTPLSTPPAGFNGVLTAKRWMDVIDFARVADAAIVTSMATSVGARDANGVWTPANARRWLEFSKAHGGTIAAAEFMNEPSLSTLAGVQKGYDAAAYGRDFKVFHDFARHTLPSMLIAGPGSTGETADRENEPAAPGTLRTRDLLAASGAGLDVFSYHHYGAVSARCAKTPGAGIAADAALSEAWLSRTDQTLAYYQKLRDEFEPGKPIWLTETAQAACGGDIWASTFLDSFRYLDQMGRLAKASVRVVMHNTLAASDYGLLDEKTFTPRPNYWAALLWHRLMGTTVLESGVPITQGLHVYAACLRGQTGGVALLAINNDVAALREIELPVASMRYTLSAPMLQSKTVLLNGKNLELTANGYLPRISGHLTEPGKVMLEPATITFLAMPRAANSHCH